MTYTYLFVLGRTPDLAYAELRSFFPNAKRISPDVVQVAFEQELSPSAFIKQIGGTVKIAKLEGTMADLRAQELIAFFPAQKGELHFGVSMYADTLRSALLAQMKALLDKQGIKARYATARHGDTLSSVTVDKKHIVELIVVKTDGGYVVGRTEAVQPYEEWGKRDYGRPYADAKGGMLPPKVARMLVNIALPSDFRFSTFDYRVLLDPFCGMGTVLSEAYLAGWHVMGSDSSQEAVQKAKANLDWLAGLRPQGAGKVGNIFVCDAVHVSDVLPPASVTSIATEPYMGSTNIVNKPSSDASDVKNTIKGLEKLYIGCLRDWSKILVSGGKVVIALPEYAFGGRVYFVKKVIDMCENLGYTIEDGPIAYSRPQAIVRRKFYILRYGPR